MNVAFFDRSIRVIAVFVAYRTGLERVIAGEFQLTGITATCPHVDAEEYALSLTIRTFALFVTEEQSVTLSAFPNIHVLTLQNYPFCRIRYQWYLRQVIYRLLLMRFCT
jgi:hypothetical protein